MSIVYCAVCDKRIDTDFNAEHFDDHKLYESVAAEYFCIKCGTYLGKTGDVCNACNNN